MKQLLVRNLEDRIVRELKVRAASKGNSAEEEHRQILREALSTRGASPSLKGLLTEFPDAGDDRDFERPSEFGKPIEF